MKILWDKKLIKLSNGSYIAWGLKRKKFFFANKNELKLNCAIIEYYEGRERCDKKVISDLKETIDKLREQFALRYDLEDKIKELEETNKANEWHYVKDGDYPKDKGNYLVAWKRTHHIEEYGKWGFDVDLFNVDEGYFEGVGDYVIAWKEIVLPKEIKE